MKILHEIYLWENAFMYTITTKNLAGARSVNNSGVYIYTHKILFFLGSAMHEYKEYYCKILMLAQANTLPIAIRIMYT